MKRIYTLLFFLTIISQLILAQKNDINGIPVSPERSRDYDAINYRVELSFDLNKKYMEGSNTITFTPLCHGLSTLKLDAQFLTVTDVLSNGTPLSYKQTDDNVFINLQRNYSYNDTVVITVHYYLDKEINGLRFIDAEGDRPEQVSSNCFPNKARQWIPCYDFPNDKVSQEFIITTDSKYKVLSNGKLISINENNNGTSTWYWQQEKPHSTYLISLSIADYLVVKDSLGDLPVNYWVYKSMADDVERVFGKTPYMIDLYNHIYRYEFPWDKYDQVISGYMGGGAEATSATLLGEGIVTDEYTEQDYYREYVIAHEIAHQWWGDLITCRSWEHTWLNESFGTYSDHLYTRYDKGRDEGDYDLLLKKNTYLDEAHNRFMRPIVYMDYEHPGDNFNRHTYQKGACMLHLLRHILGDDTFFRVISTFLHRHEFQAVTTYDFIKCLKDISGKNMDWYFDQFFFRPGHPVFNVSKSWDATKKELNITIIQEQDKWDGVPIYKIPVSIGVYLENDKKIVKEFWLKEKKEEIVLQLTSKPLMVRFDEGNFLLKEWTYKKDIDELLFQANNDDMTGRLWAVEQLDEYQTDKRTLECWQEIAENDSFWAVRAAAVSQVGKFYGTSNISLLKRAASEKSSKVRTAAVRALGDLKNPSLKDYYKQIFNQEDSYAVKSEALIAIGKCGNTRDISFLESAGRQKSYRDVVYNASQEGITIIKEKNK